MLAPIYIAEISSARLRRRMVSVNELNIVIGFSAAYYANYFILHASQNESAFATAIGLDQYAWRWMLGLEALPAALYFLCMLIVPESPRWLMLQGRRGEGTINNGAHSATRADRADTRRNKEQRA